MNENDKFNKYMTDFKTKSTSEKKQIVFKQLKLLASITNDYCKEIGSDNEIIINKELLDLNNKDYNLDDYLEALVTLISSIQNSFCDFHDRMIDIVNQIKRNMMN